MGWREKAPPGPVSTTVLVVAVVLGVLMVGIGLRVLAGSDLPQSPRNVAASDRLGWMFTVPGGFVAVASLLALLVRRRRRVLARAAMLVAAVALVVAGLVLIVGFIGIPMLLVAAALLVAAFTDEEPGPSVRRAL
ncbi:MAG: hypothetical protein Q8Q02_06630 [Nocardioides sp.]|nr:hypothetical protein [Nocardioides sp.]